jgi:hypothetical protein
MKLGKHKVLGMTKALYNIKKTFSEMIELHKAEIQNHQNLIENFSEAAKKTDNKEESLVYIMEAYRNREHQRSHEFMVKLYTFLKENEF